MTMKKKPSILIANSNDYEAEILSKDLSQTFEITAITHDGEETVTSILNLHPDVVIIDIILPSIDGPGVIETCKTNLDKNNIPSFIVTASQSTQKFIQFINPEDIDYYIIKPFQSHILSQRIQQIVRLKHMNHQIQQLSKDHELDFFCPTSSQYIRQDVTKLIRDLGIPAHLKGYQYIREAIIMAIEDINAINYVTKLLYPSIAKKYHTTSSSVERAIRHAIDIVWNKGNIELLNKMIGYSIHSHSRKPTNSEFIALAADKLRLNYQISVS